MPWIGDRRWRWTEQSIRIVAEKLSRCERKLDLLIGALKYQQTTHLSPEDQKRLNQIYAEAKDTSRRIDESMS